VETVPRTDTAVIGLNCESTYWLLVVTVRWNCSVGVLIDSISVVWNASPNPSISPHPIMMWSYMESWYFACSVCFRGPDIEKIRLQIF